MVAVDKGLRHHTVMAQEATHCSIHADLASNRWRDPPDQNGGAGLSTVLPRTEIACEYSDVDGDGRLREGAGGDAIVQIEQKRRRWKCSHDGSVVMNPLVGFPPAPDKW
jgi:hypothetical protein